MISGLTRTYICINRFNYMYTYCIMYNGFINDLTKSFLYFCKRIYEWYWYVVLILTHLPLIIPVISRYTFLLVSHGYAYQYCCKYRLWDQKRGVINAIAIIIGKEKLIWQNCNLFNDGKIGLLHKMPSLS